MSYRTLIENMELNDIITHQIQKKDCMKIQNTQNYKYNTKNKGNSLIFDRVLRKAYLTQKSQVKGR